MSKNQDIKILVEALVDEIVKAVKKEQVYVPRPRNPIQSEPVSAAGSGNLKMDILTSIDSDKQILKSIEEEMSSDTTSPEEMKYYVMAKSLLIKTISEKEAMISSMNKIDKVKMS